MELAGLFGEGVRFETELWNVVDERLREAHDLPLSRFESMQVIDCTPRCRVKDIAGAPSITVGGTGSWLTASRRPDYVSVCLTRTMAVPH